MAKAKYSAKYTIYPAKTPETVKDDAGYEKEMEGVKYTKMAKIYR